MNGRRPNDQTLCSPGVTCPPNLKACGWPLAAPHHCDVPRRHLDVRLLRQPPLNVRQLGHGAAHRQHLRARRRPAVRRRNSLVTESAPSEQLRAK